MSEWLTRVINENLVKGKAEGIAEGKAEGTLKTLSLLVHEGLISVKDAARVANMSQAAFCEKAGLPLPQ